MSSQPARRRWKVWIRLGGSAIALSALLLVLPFDELKSAMTRIPPGTWFIGLGIYLCLHLIGVAKWRLASNSAGAGLSSGTAIRCYYAGLFGNTFLPSIVGGDVVRAGLAFRHVDSKAGLLFGSFLDRLLDFVALIAVATTGALLLPTALDVQSRHVFIAASVFVGLLTLAAVGLLLIVPYVRVSFKLRRRVVQLRRAARAIARKPAAITGVIGLGITLQFTLVMLNAWLSAACGIHVPLAMWLFVWPLAKLSGVLPVTQNGIGVREVAQVALFAPFGVSAVLAAAAGLVFESIIITGGLVAGGISFVVGRLAERADHRAEQTTFVASEPEAAHP